MLLRCSKKRSHFCDETKQHTRLTSVTTSTQLILMRLNPIQCKLKHA